MSNKDKFEKDSIEELKKSADEIILDFGDVKLTPMGDWDVLMYCHVCKSMTGFKTRWDDGKITVLGCRNTHLSPIEGATDDNHRFKFTEK